MEAAGVVEVDGARLDYFSEGTGLPVLVLNGRYYPRTFSSAIREQLQLIFFDTRVFIPLATPTNLDRITMDRFVEDIEAVRQALGLEQVAKIC
jgi:proline iminopeptidase